MKSKSKVPAMFLVGALSIFTLLMFKCRIEPIIDLSNTNKKNNSYQQKVKVDKKIREFRYNVAENKILNEYSS